MNSSTSQSSGGKKVSLAHRWSIILAGGEGVRLRGLTRFVCGDERPKQFCPLLSNRTLLQEAKQRAERSISPERVLYSLTQDHQEYFLNDLGDHPSQRAVQPCNKGTAPAIVHTLLRIAKKDPDAVVAILPCDHYYSREDAFTTALESAFAITAARPGSVVLLGAQSIGPEVAYGWIEIGEVVGPGLEAFQVKRFHEKPTLPLAEHLFKSGSLWNTFVMVGHIDAFFELAEATVPELLRVLRSAPTFLKNGSERQIVEWVYSQIEAADFSRLVLSPGARRLLTVPLGDIAWDDLGDPDRVISVLLGMNAELPIWATQWRTAREAEQPATRSRYMAAG